MTRIGLLLMPDGRLIVDISSFVYISAEVRVGSLLCCCNNSNIPVIQLLPLQY